MTETEKTSECQTYANPVVVRKTEQKIRWGIFSEIKDNANRTLRASRQQVGYERLRGAMSECV